MSAQERLLERVEQEIKFLSRFDIPSDCRHIRLLSDLRGEIQRLDRHMERLGGHDGFIDELEQVAVFLVNRSPVATGEELGYATTVDEAKRLITYARTHRFEDA